MNVYRMHQFELVSSHSEPSRAKTGLRVCANSVDPDRTAQMNAQSDLGLRCSVKRACSVLRMPARTTKTRGCVR